MSCSIKSIRSNNSLSGAGKDRVEAEALAIWERLKTSNYNRVSEGFVISKKNFFGESSTLASKINSEYGIPVEANKDRKVVVRVMRLIKGKNVPVYTVQDENLIKESDLSENSHVENYIQEREGEYVVHGEVFASREDALNEVQVYLQKTSYSEMEADTNLNNNLKSFLTSVGFTVENISNYLNSNANRTKESYSAIALADMMNRIVAVDDGKAKLDTLPEEAAHVAIELLGYNHALVRAILRNIDKTNTYKNTFEEYNKDKIYQNKDGSVNVDKIKIESAGKLLAQSIIKNNNTITSAKDRNILQRIWDMFMRKIGLIKREDFNKVVENSADVIADKILNKELGLFKQTPGKDIYFQKEVNKAKKKLDSLLAKQKERYKHLKKKGTARGLLHLTQERIDQFNKDLESNLENKYALGVVSFISQAKEDVTEAIEKVSQKDIMDSSEVEALRDFLDYYETIIEDLLSSFEIDGLQVNENETEEQRLNRIEELRLLETDFSKLERIWDVRHKKNSERFVTDNNKNEKIIATDELEDMGSDISSFSFWAFSLRNAKSNILRMVHKAVTDVKQAVHRAVYGEAVDLISAYKEFLTTHSKEDLVNMMYEFDSEGVPTGYFQSKINYSKFNDSRNEMYAKVRGKNIPEDSAERELYFEIDENDSAETKAKKAKEKADYYRVINSWYRHNTQPIDNVEEVIAKNKKILSEIEHAAWLSENTTEIGNTRYYKGELSVPMRSKYSNSKFINRYDSNPVFKNMYDTIINLKIKSQGNLPYTGNDALDLLKIPQISKKVIERVKFDSSVLGEFKEYLLDEYTTRVDDDMFSTNTDGIKRPDGTRAKFVPVRYIGNLENPEDISRDLVSMMITYYDMSENFIQMSKLAPELENITRSVEDAKFKGIKLGKESATYRLLDSFLNAEVYGETKEKLEWDIFGRKINATKLISNFNSFVRRNNLAGKFFTIATGFFSGIMFSKIETFIGEHINSKSSLWAEKEMILNLPKVIAGISNISQTNHMQSLFERHKVFKSAKEMFKHTGANRAIRFVTDNAFYGGYAAADYYVKGKVALAVYDNFRLYNDRFITMDEFRSKKGYNKNNKKEVNAEWDSLRDKSLYYAYENNNGKSIVKKEFKKYVTPEIENLTMMKISGLTSKIDGVVSDMDRSNIQRSVWGQLIATHRGWMLNGLQNRLKRAGFDYSTDKYEVGYYRGFASAFPHLSRTLVNTMLEMFRMGDVKLALAGFYELKEHEKIAVYRTLTDLSVAASMLVVSTLLNNMADDDEEDWFKQYLAYQSTRLLIESSAFINPLEIPSLMKSPAAGVRQVEMIMDILALIDGREVKRGVYKGMSRRQKWLAKITPGVKSYYDLKDPRSKNRYLQQTILKKEFGSEK